MISKCTSITRFQLEIIQWLFIPSAECMLEPESGDGSEMVIQYYFDTSEMSCKKFKYSGSGGNENRFNSKDDCAEYCKVSKPEIYPISDNCAEFC